MNGNFQMAAQFAEKLINESAWSPAIYTWMQAVALLAIDNNAGTGDTSSINLATSYEQFVITTIKMRIKRAKTY